MKKLLISCTLVIVATCFTFAQVPDDLKNIFKIQHPGAAAVTWNTVEDGLYKVSFMEDGEKHVAVYDKDMKTVWQRTELTETHVPVPVREYVTTYYAGQNINQTQAPVLVLYENGESVY